LWGGQLFITRKILGLIIYILFLKKENTQKLLLEKRLRNKQVYISSFTDNEVVQSSGIASGVFEYIPEDCGQKNELEKISYFSRLHQYLLNYRPGNCLFKTTRFCSLGGKLFVNADKSFIENVPLKCVESPGFYKYFFTDGHFQEATIINGDDYCKINGSYFRLISLSKSYPESSSFNFFSAIGDYVVQFKKTNQDIAIRQMEFKRNIFNGSRYKEKRDIEGDHAYHEAETFLENLKKGSESHFSSEVYIIIKADTELELFEKTDSMTKFLSATSLSYIIESESLTELFPSILFGLEATFKRNIPVDSSYLINLLPMTRDFVHEDGSRFFSLDNLDNDVLIDIFDKTSSNYNALVIGPSGNGKSWLVQKISKDLLARGIGGIIFDLGVSHLKYCLYHNAKVFSSKFNPLQFRDPNYLHALILSVIPESEVSFKQRGMILKQIKSALVEDINTFEGLIHYIEREMEGFSLYFEELLPFITDEYCPIEKLVYVDTSAYPDNIKAPLIIFLFEYFEHIEGKKIFVFDECWKFLKSVGWFIQERFRTLRRKNASAIAISQGFDEFLSTEIGRAVVENCYHKFIFQQAIKKNEILTDFDIEATTQVRSEKGVYSEFYYKSEIHKKKLRCYGTTREKELFTSEGDDNNRLDIFFNTLGTGHTFKTLFDTYMKTFFPESEQ
jgi:hypothetical protein